MTFDANRIFPGTACAVETCGNHATYRALSGYALHAFCDVHGPEKNDVRDRADRLGVLMGLIAHHADQAVSRRDLDRARVLYSRMFIVEDEFRAVLSSDEFVRADQNNRQP